MKPDPMTAAIVAALLLAGTTAQAADAPLTFTRSSDGKGLHGKPARGVVAPSAKLHEMRATLAADGSVRIDCKSVPNPVHERWALEQQQVHQGAEQK